MGFLSGLWRITVIWTPLMPSLPGQCSVIAQNANQIYQNGVKEKPDELSAV